MPLLTITRGSFGASRRVAQLVGQELDCNVTTREQVIDHAREYGIEETEMATTDFMEKHPPHLWDRHAAQRRLYLIYFRASLLDYAAEGRLIYLGHMGQFLFSDVPILLRVRVDASMDLRINDLMKQTKMSEAEAKRHVKDIDIKRRRWAKFLYDEDYDSPHHYDIVLNLARMTVETAAELVLQTLKRPEWKHDDKTTQTIKNVRLSAIVSARLARSKRTRGMELAVDCDEKGHAVLKGVPPLIGAATWVKDIKEVVMGVEGITSAEVIDLR